MKSLILLVIYTIFITLFLVPQLVSALSKPHQSEIVNPKSEISNFTLSEAEVPKSEIPILPQSARELADKAREVIENTNFEMSSTLRIIDDKGRERVRKMWMATRSFHLVTKSMIRFLEPAEVNGIAMLVFDFDDKPDDMWMYLPSLRKERRIVADEKAKSFMGSEFSNSDLSVPDTESFTYNLMGSEHSEGHEYLKIEAICKDDQARSEFGYSRKVMWIDATTFLTLKIEFYDFKGQLSKIQRFTGYKKLSNGKYFAFSMTKENVQTGRRSEITVNQFRENSTLPESSFTPAMMQV